MVVLHEQEVPVNTRCHNTDRNHARNRSFKVIASCAVLAMAGAATAQVIEPTHAASVNPYGVNGLSQVVSAEPVGAGRLNLQLRGNFFRQDATITGAQPSGAEITTVSGGIGMGLNEYLDAFAALHIFNRRQTSPDGSGFGTAVLGAQANIPLSRDVPFHAGAQVAALFGTAGNQLNSNDLDGYNYLETRTSHDVMVRLTQSWLGLRDGKGVKVHLNEGIISSFQSGKDIALVTGVGVEIIPIVSMIIGLEANSRTYLQNPSLSDPLWVTPSLTWRTPVFVNIHGGVDIALSEDRSSGPVRALEPWRVFGGLTYSVDTRATEKREAREKARRDSLERAALQNQLRLAESCTDSISSAAAAEAARQQALSDSLARKARADSLAMATRLEEERAKRSDMEKQLLTTGLLVLDAVYFETGKTDISINSEPYLTIIAKMLTKYPKLQIEIGGHTDNVGGEKYNQTLSQGRAAAVVGYMLRISPDLQGRITPRGYGYSQPKADNSTAEGRQLNRRTELKVLNPAALQEYR